MPKDGGNRYTCVPAKKDRGKNLKESNAMIDPVRAAKKQLLKDELFALMEKPDPIKEMEKNNACRLIDEEYHPDCDPETGIPYGDLT